MTSFLPTFIDTNDWNDGGSLTTSDVSLILSIFSVAQIIFAPLNGTIKNWLGAKNTIIVGFFMLTLTTAGLGLISYIKDAQYFFYSAMVLRFFQGQGDVLLQITGYSIVTSIFTDNMMKYIGYVEICVGLGLGLGPTIGSVFYSYLEYAGTMYLFAGLDGLGMLVCIFFIPGALNETVSEEELAQMEFFEEMHLEESVQQKRESMQITWWTLIKNKYAMFTLLTCFVGTFNVTFWSGYYSTDLALLGFDVDYVGYVLGAMSFTYLIGCLILPLTCEHGPRRFQFVIALIGMGLTCFLLGPSKLLGFPNNEWLVVTAFPVMGVFQVFVFIPIIPEIYERMQLDLGIVEGEDEVVDARLNDKVNDAYGLIYATSQFVSPNIGTWLYGYYGARTTADIVALFNLGLAAVMFVFNCGPFVFSENRKFQEKLAKLQAGEVDKDEDAGTADTGVNTSYIDPEEVKTLKGTEIKAEAALNLKRTKSLRTAKQRPNLLAIDSYKNQQAEKVSLLRAKVSIAKRSVAMGERKPL